MSRAEDQDRLRATRNAPTGGECAAVGAVEFIDSIAINDKFALVAARQVEGAHQTSRGS